jgi:hypothetical protein
MRTDGKMDRRTETKLIVTFRTFAKTRKSEGVVMNGHTFCTSICSFLSHNCFMVRKVTSQICLHLIIRLLSTHQEMFPTGCAINLNSHCTLTRHAFRNDVISLCIVVELCQSYPQRWCSPQPLTPTP